MDRLQLINIFVTVVDTGGFAGAARKLNVSPPVVTRAINELEAGACQGGCRLSYAANGWVSMLLKCVVTTESRSGLSVTTPM